MASEEFGHLCGYVYDEKAISAFIDSGAGRILQAGELVSGKGLEGFIFEIEEQLTGKVRPPAYQKIGSCVSKGVSGACEDLQFVQMCNDPTLVFKSIASEVVYGVARVQIGKGGCGYGDGAVVAWALDGIREYGLVARGKYGNIDLTDEDDSYAKKWGAPRVGAPAELAEMGKLHLVLQAHLIESNRGGPTVYEQSRDVIANRGLIVTGSNQLFASSRDKDGFCGRGGRGGHCTYYRGFTDNSKRPGIVYQQSWGPQVPSQGLQSVTLPSGRVVKLPPGAFFIDANEFDRMHTGGGNEVWAITAEVGWVPPDSEINFKFYLPNGDTMKFLTKA